MAIACLLERENYELSEFDGTLIQVASAPADQIPLLWRQRDKCLPKSPSRVHLSRSLRAVRTQKGIGVVSVEQRTLSLGGGQVRVWCLCCCHVSESRTEAAALEEGTCATE